jgi:hypothetical protein
MDNIKMQWLIDWAEHLTWNLEMHAEYSIKNFKNIGHLEG